MIKKYAPEIGFISLIIALLAWLGISPSSFKSVIYEKVPDWVFRIAIILIIGRAIYITIKIRKLLRTEITNIGVEFEKHREVDSKVEEQTREQLQQLRNDVNKVYKQQKEYKKYEKLEPANEIKFILEKIVSQPQRVLEYRYLEEFHKKEFNKDVSDFNIIMNKLKLIRLCYETEAGDFGEMAFAITSEGLEHLAAIKTNKLKKKK